MDYFLLSFCCFNLLMILLISFGLRRRPREIKNMGGKILVHKFVTKKVKDTKENK